MLDREAGSCVRAGRRQERMTDESPPRQQGWPTELAAHELATQANSLGTASLAPSPWRRDQLLTGPDAGGSAVYLAEQAHLVERAEVLLQHEGEDRWVFVRRFIAECRDALLLRYLCNSPALFGPDAIAVRLLARGSHRHVSCALYALSLAPGRVQETTRLLLPELERLPREQAAARVLDIYAQTWLDRGEPEMLRATLLRWLIDQIEAGPEGERWLVALQRGLSQDARSLRQVFLLADLGELLRSRSGQTPALLHQELLRTFFAAFTPAGVSHPLADALWRARLGDALAEAAESHPELAERLEQFGVGLPALAAAWVAPGQAGEAPAHQAPAPAGEGPADGPSLSPEAQRLASLFLRLFGGTVVHAARALWRRRAGTQQALAFYGLLARVLATQRLLAGGAGAFGALEHLLPLEDGAAGISPELLQKAAFVEQRALEHPRQVARRVRWLPASLRDELRSSSTLSQPFLPVMAPGEVWDGRPVWAARLPSRPRESTLPTLLGLDALLLLLRLPLRLFGYCSLDELALEEHHIILRRVFKLLGLRVGRRVDQFPLEGLRADLRPSPAPLFVRLAGWIVLLTSAVLGTLLLFAGLDEAGVTTQALLGIGVIVGGLLYDASCHHRYLQWRDEGVLVLHPLGQPQPVALSLLRQDRELVGARLGAAR